MLLQLLRPFSYLTIDHPSALPKWINWGLPACFSFVLVCTAAALKLNVDVFGPNGLTARVLSFVQSLPGFYLAALAAIATFNNADMLKAMPGVPPTMNVLYNGSPTRINLNRRRFLSAMFAFLTASSVTMTMISIAALAVAEPVRSMIDPVFYPWVKAGFVFVFLTINAQMVSITMWGLYYLGERLHTPD